ncbi:MAG: hypothetical protein ABJG78_19205 [Cyclobacteriaceae bacterium]
MTNDSIKPPVWFWIVSGIALIWNAMGIQAYLDQAYMTPEKLSGLPEAQQAMYIDNPAWVTAAFAIAVFGGTIASILLLLKKKLAYTVFVVSLAGILAQMSYAFFMSGATDSFGPGGMIMPIMIILAGAALVYLSKKAISNGWLS